MLSTLIVCLYFTTNIYAEHISTRSISSATSISTSTNAAPDSSLSSAEAITLSSSPVVVKEELGKIASLSSLIDVKAELGKIASTSSPVDVKEELDKITSSCLTSQDYELLTGNALRHSVARIFSHTLIEESVETIGLRELRGALGLPAPGPWQRYNRTKPSEHELASASTLEEYYDLKEPRSKMRSLDSEFLFEHNVATAIAYLNERLPSIQAVFRRKFEEACPTAPEVLDRKAIDRMLDAFHTALVSIHRATSRMLGNEECWEW